MEMKTMVTQKQILEHFNLSRDTLVAMEKEGIPSYKISAREKEYEIEKVAEWLSEGGEETIFNAVGVCANCHRRLHVLNDENDVTKLKAKLEQYKNEGND
ncbi:hypothetical protein [Bacillus mycoides]|uniref:hypothetical protein n=1 Tax=Bacillus mycoides TaxID=1405 RepID=UPI001C0137F2|nr:hypothetical protein [Bacillus mycoides]QWG33331.1 hypothetical protein EXW30_10530 [Bacillus mycoides]